MNDPLFPDSPARHARRRELLRQITQESQELGLYDMDFTDDELTELSKMPTRREIENLKAALQEHIPNQKGE